MRLPVLSLAVLTALLAPAARAADAAPGQDCPSTIPDGSKQRRALAKEWFSRAEGAETAGDDTAAVRAYACSLKVVPHAFTAYNLGRVAEKTGDLEMALEGYQTYLKLSPDAKDREDITARATALEARVAEVKERQAAARRKAAEEDEFGPRKARTPPRPVVLEPVNLTAAAATDDGASTDTLRLRQVAWLVGGAGAAALVGGIVMNISARGRMSDCRSLAGDNDLDAARSSCNGAKTMAHGSYALLALSGIAAAVDAGIIWKLRSTPVRGMAFVPLRGGGAVSASLRF